MDRAPAVWTLAHKGFSGGGRLDVWVYPTRQAALRAGAQLALDCGLDEDPEAVRLYQLGDYRKLLRRYEAMSADGHLMRVQAAFLQDDPALGESPAGLAADADKEEDAG